MSEAKETNHQVHAEETEKQKRARTKTIVSLLRALEGESEKKGAYDLVGEGMFLSVVRASFVKAFEYARYCNTLKPNKADEGAFYFSSALRGICEELIALQFIRQLAPAERNEVIAIEMSRSVAKAADE